MNLNLHSLEEQAVASAVASLGEKRERDLDSPDAAGGIVSFPPTKVARIETACMDSPTTPIVAAPFFHYKDYSNVNDPDPLTPLTAPGRVPNFPAKMMAILARADLSDIITWMPHGRSWRVLKPREFELRVIPTYFEHSKFSSFIRQANGWGFRRITQGRDRNSYYHELFLRGMPHLCKQMKRPGVSEKVATDVDHEPDFYKISELHPLPEKAEDDSIMLQCTVQGGPKARMPVYCGPLTSLEPESLKSPPKLPDPTVLAAFQEALNASEKQVRTITPDPSNNNSPLLSQPLMPSPFTPGLPFTTPLTLPTTPAAAAQAAASQFAAGFAAATALSSASQFQTMLGQAMGAAPQFPVVAPAPQNAVQDNKDTTQQQQTGDAFYASG